MEAMGLRQTIIIAFSFFIGMVLDVLPLPQWAIWARPEWVFIILLYWMIALPHRMGFVVALLLGVIVDLLTGTLLGQHAFAFVAVTYLVLKLHSQLKHFPLWQQVGMIFILSLLALALQYWAMELAGGAPRNWGYWLPSLTNAIIWPWFCVLLRDRQEAIREF